MLKRLSQHPVVRQGLETLAGGVFYFGLIVLMIMLLDGLAKLFV